MSEIRLLKLTNVDVTFQLLLKIPFSHWLTSLKKKDNDIEENKERSLITLPFNL